MAAQILIVDDHHIVRDGLRLLLERAGFKVSGEAADGLAAAQMAAQIRPDVVVMDIGIPLLNGLDAARKILKDVPTAKVIFLSMHADKQYILEALRIGAKGFVTKSHAAEHLVQAVRDALRGKTFLNAETSEAVVAAYQSDANLLDDPLTPRERQVLQLVAEGRTTKEVAALLNISVKTAETHRSRTMEKLDIHDTATLVRYAIRRGLVQP
ncbi:MAG TPA: response regulator transcription factor [Terriglobales bacterium]|nr:response regulator transcription factor [Terriglobales bacterium]